MNWGLKNKILGVFLSLAMVFISSFGAFAANYSASYSLHELFSADISYNNSLTASRIEDSKIDANKSLLGYDFNVILGITKKVYATPLYSSGVVMYRATIPFTLPSNFTDRHIDFTIDYSDTIQGVSFSVPRVLATSSGITIYFYLFLEEAYLLAGNTELASANIRISLNGIVPIDYPSTMYTATLGDTTFASLGVEVATALKPNVLKGMGWIIYNAVDYALKQSGVTQSLDDIYYHLSEINRVLPMYFGEVISQLALQNRHLLTIEELISHYFPQYLGLLESIAYGDTDAASEVASDVASQQAELDKLESQIAVETVNIDGQLRELDSMVAEADTGTPFFFINSGGIISTILLLTFLFGLISFVLYGKGK